MSVQLLHGDCRALLGAFPPDSFDACIADPPYGDTSLRWDSRVHGWLPAVARVLKPAASLWVFGSMRFLAGIWTDIEAAGFTYSQDIVWEKQNGTGFHNDRFKRVHEHAVLFYRGPWAEVYHSPQHTDDARATVARRKTRPSHTGHINAGAYVSVDGGPRLMRSVIYAPNAHGHAIHPTQKPLELVRTLVRYSIPPGGSLVVPFVGSGTDLLVAKAEGLTAVGCELDEQHFHAASQRLARDFELFEGQQPITHHRSHP